MFVGEYKKQEWIEYLENSGYIYSGTDAHGWMYYKREGSYFIVKHDCVEQHRSEKRNKGE